MDKIEQLRIFAKNLRYYVDLSGKDQKDIARDLGYKYTTFNTWLRGAAMPTAAKIQTLADYFGIPKSYLLDEHISASGYYENEETARLAQQMYDDPQMRELYNMKRTMNPKVFQAHMDMMRKLHDLENPEDKDDYSC